jgi:hypothetical protein
MLIALTESEHAEVMLHPEDTGLSVDSTDRVRLATIQLV